MLGAFASGWNIIVRKQTAGGQQLQPAADPDYPGTGPFRSVNRVDKEVWVMDRNPDYWNEACPTWTASSSITCRRVSPQLGAALLAGTWTTAACWTP